MNDLVKPRALPRGGTVGLVAPASPAPDSLVHRGGEGPLPRRPDFPHVRTLGHGRPTARLIGGDVYELRASLGTPFETDTDESVVFFEDEGNRPGRSTASWTSFFRPGSPSTPAAWPSGCS